ncbi:DUF5004 domain-containing protein [Haliscomenobacter hydrossis]|uniref:Lipocalin-like domain-containing protein n=1 Tax=Haliscomenobacter hydrossis (strain ATCC 27775 / DSM 1100 / LMG 10767 / O) TaxID=760192 RepID=F4L2E5_HALH1|nr:DUF5004 domain-containing protein [Haliscomenobacter hydrossis]AEE52898.1 hypothetical protein Halhy_5072 [Haliscomenobacter hydrossis DSM 1100]
MFAFKTWSRLASVMAILSIALASTSCELFEKDDDKDDDNVKNKIVGTWQLKSLTSDPAIDWFGTPVTNVFAQLPACVKDDLVIIQSNNTYLEDEGTSKCQPSAPQTVSGTWALNPAQNVISVSRDGDTESWNLLNLGKTEFTAEYPIEEGGVTYTFKAVYVKK